MIYKNVISIRTNLGFINKVSINRKQNHLKRHDESRKKLLSYMSFLFFLTQQINYYHQQFLAV